MSQSIQTGSFHWMKSLNKSTIANVIRLHGPISRAEIAKLTKLTPPTVTNIVAELLESGFVVESELGTSSGGRKPIMLRINSSAFYVVGVYAGAKKIKAVTATLDGQVVRRAEEKVPANPGAEQFLSILVSTVRRVIDETNAPQKSFLGIGVGMHGLVDPRQGLSIFAPNLQLRQVNIREVLENEFALPVEVDNDVRALALGESWFGQGQGIGNFICVNIGTGVGAGIILDDRLYHGPSFTAGEMGHTTIDIDGPPCSCGNNGCLEALVSGPAMEARAREAIKRGEATLLAEWTAGKVEEITGEMIYRAAQHGDALSVKILEQTGRYLGIGISNLINTLNPLRVIISGGVSRAGDFVMASLQQTVEKRALQTPARECSIVASQLGPDGIAIGAFTLVLNKLFTPAGVGEM